MNGQHPYSFQKTPVFQPFAGLIAIFLGDKEPDCLDGFCDAIAKALGGNQSGMQPAFATVGRASSRAAFLQMDRNNLDAMRMMQIQSASRAA
jgi:hypothetical protein